MYPSSTRLPCVFNMNENVRVFDGIPFFYLRIFYRFQSFSYAFGVNYVFEKLFTLKENIL